MDEIKNYIHENMLIVLESTTYPGSTKELILPYIQNNDKNNLVPGKNICLCFSPERIDPGNKIFNTSNTPKVIGGISEKCSEVGKELYSKIIKKIISSTLKRPENSHFRHLTHHHTTIPTLTVNAVSRSFSKKTRKFIFSAPYAPPHKHTYTHRQGSIEIILQKDPKIHIFGTLHTLTVKAVSRSFSTFLSVQQN